MKIRVYTNNQVKSVRSKVGYSGKKKGSSMEIRDNILDFIPTNYSKQSCDSSHGIQCKIFFQPIMALLLKSERM